MSPLKWSIACLVLAFVAAAMGCDCGIRNSSAGPCTLPPGGYAGLANFFVGLAIWVVLASKLWTPHAPKRVSLILPGERPPRPSTPQPGSSRNLTVSSTTQLPAAHSRSSNSLVSGLLDDIPIDD